MSNIYIQEPPTNGKVLLTTSVGDIDIELWSKEAPKACRNFIQLCMESYYDNTIFHRVVKDFIVQGGDPTGTGSGGESIYGKPFKDEFHSRLRFVRRGLVAMANAGSHDNGSQFFFTLAATPELINKHTIFGKVSGNTVYNMIKLGEGDVDHMDKPLYPHKIIKTKILSNPFEDIIPRSLPKRENKEDSKRKSKSKATKNFNLLSFGEEAEEDEVETNEAARAMKGKSKSSHDLIDDPKLSTVPAMPKEGATEAEQEEEEGEEEASDDARSRSRSDEDEKKRSKRKRDQEESQITSDKSQSPSVEPSESAEKTRKKLKKDTEEVVAASNTVTTATDSEDEGKKPKSRSAELRKEVLQLKREIKEAMRRKQQRTQVGDKDKDESREDDEITGNDVVSQFKMERKKYKDLKKHQPKKGSEREQQTLALLAKFQTKLHTSQQMSQYGDEDEEETNKDDNKATREGSAEVEEEEEEDFSWISHKLQCEDSMSKVLDANVTDVERYEIYDPRNPMNQRRREASKQAMKSKR